MVNPSVADVAAAIEEFAPCKLQESYDNSGLQLGNPNMSVSAVLLSLDITEDTIYEAVERQCNMVVSHHPLLFNGLKQIVGNTPTQRIVEFAIRHNMAIYSAHTNLDSAVGGVSSEIGRMIGLKDEKILEPRTENEGLGVVGNIQPMPKMQFLRKLKEAFKVKALKYSRQSSTVVIRRVAICGGAGASLIKNAIDADADIYVTGDVKYHDFTTYGQDILIADIGHFEGELCARRILGGIIQKKYPELPLCISEREDNPIAVL